MFGLGFCLFCVCVCVFRISNVICMIIKEDSFNFFISYSLLVVVLIRLSFYSASDFIFNEKIYDGNILFLCVCVCG